MYTSFLNNCCFYRIAALICGTFKCSLNVKDNEFITKAEALDF